ncbi:MAG: hypothetical protein WCP29_18405, partial [Acidobacteriota bacterium]
MNVRPSRLGTLAILVPVLFLLSGQVARAQSAAELAALDKEAIDLMEKAVRQSVSKTGVQVIVVGSSVKGNYNGPLAGGLSDHDMRVVLGGETDRSAARLWKQFQTTLKENIEDLGLAKRLSPEQIQKLINSTNVYPPSQLVSAVADAEDAVSLFQRLGSNPNLGGAVPEGYWGPGSKSYLHYYEDKAGKLFYADPATGRVMTGAADLTHLTEGLERLTTGGEVNRGLQCLEKALDELGNGNVDKAVKQAKRLQEALKKARGLENLAEGGTAYLNELAGGAVKDPEKIRSLLARAEQELTAIGRLAVESDVDMKNLLRGVLGSEARGMGKVSQLFSRYAGQLSLSEFLLAVQVYMNYTTLRDASNLSPAEFNGAVLNTSSKQLAWLSGLAPGLTMEIADAVLEIIKSNAYTTVTAFQDCVDLASGVHSVPGRAEANKGWTLDQMATKFPDTPDGNAGLSTFIAFQASQASLRLENNVWVEDKTLSAALFSKCYAPIVRLWKQNRLARITAFNALFVEFDKQVSASRALLNMQPGSPVPMKEQGGLAATVTFEASSTLNAAKANELLEKMNAILTFLEGGKATQLVFSTTIDTLVVDGKEVDSNRNQSLKKQLVYTAPADHKATLTREPSFTATVVSDDIPPNWVVKENGFVRVFPTSSATIPFSVVKDATVVKGTVSIVGPASVKVGDNVALSAVVKFTGAPPTESLRYRWTEETGGLRLSSAGPFQSLNTSQPTTYTVRVDAFVVVDSKEVPIGTARHTLRVE